MVVCCLLVTFLLGVNLFDQVSVQAKNVSDILHKQKENLLQTLTNDSKNILGLKNESYYELECDCGIGSRFCHYNKNGEKICDCIAGYAQNNNMCDWCYCGRQATSCTFEYNKKVCTCQKNYLQNDYGECEECDCGYDAISCQLNYWYKECTCREGYTVERGKCVKECDCGYGAISCHLEGFSKICTCSEGYIDEYGTCERCDCGPNSISCELSSGKYTRCKCVAGYVAERSTWEMDEYCKLPGVNGWRIATYVESVVFALIIIVCTIMICYRRYRKGV